MNFIFTLRKTGLGKTGAAAWAVSAGPATSEDILVKWTEPIKMSSCGYIREYISLFLYTCTQTDTHTLIHTHTHTHTYTHTHTHTHTCMCDV